MCGGYTQMGGKTDEERNVIRHNAAVKAWVTRRANARRREYQARAKKAWVTRRANKYYGTKEQSTVTKRLSDMF